MIRTMKNSVAGVTFYESSFNTETAVEAGLSANRV